MISSEKTSWIVPVLIATVLTVIFGIFAVDPFSNGRFQNREDFDYTGRPIKNLPAKVDRIVLAKNKEVTIGRNKLVFRGRARDSVLIDLYLLDMDPEQPYRKRFVIKEAKKELVIGEGRYRLLTVNNSILVLQDDSRRQ